MKAELSRRHSLTDELERRKRKCRKVWALFESRPHQWITAAELMCVGGRQAWRSRVADARRILRRQSGDILNRQERARGRAAPRHPRGASVLETGAYTKTPG